MVTPERKKKPKTDYSLNLLKDGGCCSGAGGLYVIPAAIVIVIIYYFLLNLYLDLFSLFDKNLFELFTTPELYFILAIAAISFLLATNPFGWGVCTLIGVGVVFSVAYSSASINYRESIENMESTEPSNQVLGL